jgi:hypothetical protein
LLLVNPAVNPINSLLSYIIIIFIFNQDTPITELLFSGV